MYQLFSSLETLIKGICRELGKYLTRSLWQNPSQKISCRRLLIWCWTVKLRFSPEINFFTIFDPDIQILPFCQKWEWNRFFGELGVLDDFISWFKLLMKIRFSVDGRCIWTIKASISWAFGTADYEDLWLNAMWICSFSILDFRFYNCLFEKSEILRIF